MTSHILPGSLSADDFHLSPKEADEYEIVRLRNAAFHAIYTLWKEREAEGLRQQDLADRLGRDKSWVSRALKGPANWEFKTFARLVRALCGEVEIKVHPIEKAADGENFNAYVDFISGDTAFKKDGYFQLAPAPKDGERILMPALQFGS